MTALFILAAAAVGMLFGSALGAASVTVMIRQRAVDRTAFLSAGRWYRVCEVPDWGQRP